MGMSIAPPDGYLFPYLEFMERVAPASIVSVATSPPEEAGLMSRTSPIVRRVSVTRPFLIVAVLLAPALASMPAAPAFAQGMNVLAAVDVDANVRAKAVLTKIEWVDPHAIMDFNVIKPDGTVQRN